MCMLVIVYNHHIETSEPANSRLICGPQSPVRGSGSGKKLANVYGAAPEAGVCPAEVCEYMQSHAHWNTSTHTKEVS